jgi:environmental stress-induced protein Ves
MKFSATPGMSAAEINARLQLARVANASEFTFMPGRYELEQAIRVPKGMKLVIANTTMNVKLEVG